MKTEPICQFFHEPKSLDLEKTEDGRYRVVITVKKLGAVTAVEFFLDPGEAQQFSEALTR